MRAPAGFLACVEEARPLTPEVRLFRHIILHAVLDAIYGSPLRYETRVKADAWNWFMRGGPDFRKVCECAGWHPDTVRQKALRYIAKQRETPDSPTRPAINSHGESAIVRRKAA